METVVRCVDLCRPVYRGIGGLLWASRPASSDYAGPTHHVWMSEVLDKTLLFGVDARDMSNSIGACRLSSRDLAWAVYPSKRRHARKRCWPGTGHGGKKGENALTGTSSCWYRDWDFPSATQVRMSSSLVER